MDRGNPFRLKALNSESDPTTVTTGSDGKIWLLIGSVTTYNGKTTLYYDDLTARFEKVKSKS